MSWSTAWRIARRDLNARFKGLRLLLVCIFLGTAALAAIGTLTAAIERELAANGQQFLGGDLQVELWQRSLSEEERAALEELGTVSAGTRLQAMARKDDTAAPIELKAVDELYPLYGELVLEGGRKVTAPSGNDAYIAPGAADRLGLETGDSFLIGTKTLQVAGIIEDEPDRLGEGFQLGPTIIVAEDVPQRAGLLAPGAMYQSKTRVAFDTPRDLEAAEEDLEERFPEAGFDIDTAERAAPGTDRFVSRMSEFLILVGLAALVIAGIGIGGGVSSYLDARRQSVATLKILGATSRDIARIYALQIFAAAAVGSLAGLAVGVAVVPLLAAALEGLLPVDTGFVIDPGALLLATAYGLLVALVFAAPPLMRARHFPAMALMRSNIAPLARDRSALFVVIAGLAAINGLALITASQPLLSGGFLLGAAVVLALLALLGWAIRKIAAALPRPASPIARTALANIHRPGSSTGALVTALGFGLASFVLLAAVQSSIDGNIEKRVPAQAPDYFVLDVPREQEDRFRELILQTDADAAIRTVPALRGSVLAFGPDGAMTRTSELEEIPDGAWALRGERGLTYADDVPPGNSLTEGQWWGPAYDGPPLVSIDEEFAEAAGLGIGDRLTFGVLGVEVETEIASLRRIDWESMGFNYVFVLSPNALENTPHNLAATVELAEGTPTGPLLQALVRELPSTSVIEVGGVLQQARTILEQVGLATLAAASVAVLAGLAVLLGAIAAARASRTYDTVVLRVLGADRRQVLVMQLIEYALLAGALAIVALGLGSLTAWLVVTQLFEFDWLPDWTEVLLVLGLGLATVLVFAVGGSLPLLRAKPAQALRAL
ncbi:ABC transporter permease [Qipengyuania nanhaisediminis]|uniref:Putative ABC transport system permease protein n=1 Tax=Qipengyuania nanhaisediminis TaxID=604088 RepID=A0A1I5NRT2_9SPHN|nr:FtsX-like permease family protein [Qipengyuania nanhaisediminis]SFP24492.1 putative ABC transport system permease protein [Qipengyuania nanhaisediminis]